jgi:hypothetical protein
MEPGAPGIKAQPALAKISYNKELYKKYGA